MKRGKKLTSEILSVRDDKKVGAEVGGIFQNLTPMLTAAGEPVMGNYGQALHTFELVDPKTGEVKKYWADGGIRGSLKMAKVKDGDKIFIQHTGTKKIDEGTVQTYDVFSAE